MRKKHWPLAPLILGFLLGPMFELALPQSLNTGGPMILINRPFPVAFYLLTIVIMLVSLKYLRHKGAVSEEDSDS